MRPHSAIFFSSNRDASSFDDDVGKATCRLYNRINIKILALVSATIKQMIKMRIKQLFIAFSAKFSESKSSGAVEAVIVMLSVFVTALATDGRKRYFIINLFRVLKPVLLSNRSHRDSYLTLYITDITNGKEFIFLRD